MMRPTMKDRRTLTKLTCERYRKASKKDKGRMLNEFVENSGYDRSYARRLLRNHGRRVEVKPGVVMEGDARRRRRPPGKPRYGLQVLAPLKKLWEMVDYPCGKRLKGALPGLIEQLEAFKELRLSKAVRAQLLSMSPATLDRRLAPERAKHTLKRRGATKPGTLLKHQIPIRTFSDWDDARPGFLEMDLVGHDGGHVQGDYGFTLDCTDVASGWTELAAVPNKAQTHVFAALRALRARLPFAVLGVDSDNGSEFINHELKRYCEAERITFTRSRPYRKNDNCYVEQKNWSVVRRFVGYARYEAPQAIALLNELYIVLSNYINFFLPSLKHKETLRDGPRIRRRYYPAQTPYQRLLQSPHADPALKRALEARYKTLNPAALHRRIRQLQRKLEKLAQRRGVAISPQTSLPRSRQNEGGEDRRGADSPPPSFVPAPETALGSLSSVALSSAQATPSIPLRRVQKTKKRNKNLEYFFT